MDSRLDSEKKRQSSLLPPGKAGRFARSILFWLAFLLILVAFTTLEFQLDQSLHGLTRKLLLIILLVLEFGSIMVWDNLKNKYQG